MPDFVTTSFYPRIDEDIYNIELLRTFLSRLSGRGHYLSGEHDQSVNAAWLTRHHSTVSEKTRTRAQQIDPQSLFVPTVTDSLRQDVESFVRHHNDELSVTVYSTDKTGPFAGFTCDITFYARESQIEVTMEDNKPDIEDLQHYLDVVQLVYSIWHPLYGYQDDPTGDVTSLEEVRSLNLSWLYGINLFGPELVEHLGRERVLSTPAWLVKTLDDTGVLLVPILFRGGGRDEEYRFHRKEVARYLGLIDELPEREE